MPKTKETREIILPAAAADAVKNMPTQGIEWVFTTSSGHPFGKGSWNYYWHPVRDAFTRELPASHWLPQRLAVDPKDKLEIYELRHFCGSLLADRGATARDIAEQLGNTAEVCERTYIHPYQNRVRARLRAAFDQPEHQSRPTRSPTKTFLEARARPAPHQRGVASPQTLRIPLRLI